MDYTIPVISFFSNDLMLFGLTCAATFFVIMAGITSYVFGFSKIKIITFVTIASGSILLSSIFSMLFAGQYAYQFSKNIVVLHQVAEEANQFEVPLDPELSAIFSEFKEGQSVDGRMEQFNLYSDLAVRLEAQMDSINSSVRGDDYADMKDFLSMCFHGKSGSELFRTMGAYPPKESDLKAQAEKVMSYYRSADSDNTEMPHGCVVSYLVPDFL